MFVLGLHKKPIFLTISYLGSFMETQLSAEFREDCPKLYGNCAFPQYLQTRELGEVSVF